MNCKNIPAYNDSQPVRDLLCPDVAGGSLSYSSAEAYRAQEKCRAGGIRTVGDLIGHSEAELRAKSFNNEDIHTVRKTLQKQGLDLKGAFASAHSHVTLAGLYAISPRQPSLDGCPAKQYAGSIFPEGPKAGWNTLAQIASGPHSRQRGHSS